MMKTVSLALALLLASTTTAVAQQSATLPATAQQFIAKHYASTTVSHTQRDRDNGRLCYEVYFNNGAKAEFDANGQWKELEGRNGIPTAALPTTLTQHLKSQHPGQAVVKAERKRNSIEIKLANGLELVYDRNGNFKRYDD